MNTIIENTTVTRAEALANTLRNLGFRIDYTEAVYGLAYSPAYFTRDGIQFSVRAPRGSANRYRNEVPSKLIFEIGHSSWRRRITNKGELRINITATTDWAEQARTWIADNIAPAKARIAAEEVETLKRQQQQNDYHARTNALNAAAREAGYSGWTSDLHVDAAYNTRGASFKITIPGSSNDEIIAKLKAV